MASHIALVSGIKVWHESTFLYVLASGCEIPYDPYISIMHSHICIEATWDYLVPFGSEAGRGRSGSLRGRNIDASLLNVLSEDISMHYPTSSMHILDSGFA